MSLDSSRWLALATALLFATLVGAYVILTGDVSKNRYTDATWHMCVADEYARTSTFAADPFVRGAPRFAQFSLWDFANGIAQRLTGIPQERLFPVSNAVVSGLFVFTCFYIGWFCYPSLLVGTFSSFAFYVIITMQTQDGLIRAGWPFQFALALYFLWFALLLKHGGALFSPFQRGVSWRRWLLLPVSLACLLAAMFDLHPFIALYGVPVSLFACLAVHAPAWRTWRISRILLSIVVVSVVFVSLSWPWWVLHLGLRASLDTVNAHHFVPQVSLFGSIPIFGALLGVVCFCYCRRGVHARMLAGCAIAFFLVLCSMHPSVVEMIAAMTSGYMARRVVRFAPVAMIMVLVLSVLMARTAEGVVTTKTTVTIVLVLAIQGGLLAPYLMADFKRHLYFMRTPEYAVHPYESLAGLPASRKRSLRGVTVLSDPFTSYFARRFVGCYGVTVPPGHASPALDYGKRDAVYMRALEDPQDTVAGSDFSAVMFSLKKDGDFEQEALDKVRAAVERWKSFASVVWESSDLVVFTIDKTVPQANK